MEIESAIVLIRKRMVGSAKRCIDFSIVRLANKAARASPLMNHSNFTLDRTMISFPQSQEDQ